MRRIAHRSYVDRLSSIFGTLALLVWLGTNACSSNPTPEKEDDQTSAGGAGSVGKAGGGGSTEAAGSAGASSTGSHTSGGSGLAAAGAAGASTATGGSSGASGSAVGSAGGGATGKGGSGGRAGSTGPGPAAGGRSNADSGTIRDAGRDGAKDEDGAAGRSGGAGGASHADATADSATSAGYKPCPTNGDPCKILPFGDSITLGMNSTDNAGYRSRLFELVVAANQNVMFVGTQSSGPDQLSGRAFPKNHEGHSGWTIDPGSSQYDNDKKNGISRLVTTAPPDGAFQNMPNIVLLHIGTNDLTSSDAKSTTSVRLDALLTKIAGVAPDALVVVAKLIPLGYSSSDWDTYNAKIPTLVQEHAAKGEHMILVDMSKLPTNQLNSVHPTDQGYTTMASYWYDAIKGYLPK